MVCDEGSNTKQLTSFFSGHIGTNVVLCLGETFFLKFYTETSHRFIKIELPFQQKSYCLVEFCTLIFPKQFTIDNSSRILICVSIDFATCFVEFLDFNNFRIHLTKSRKKTFGPYTFANLFHEHFDFELINDPLIFLQLPFANVQQLSKTPKININKRVLYINVDGTSIISTKENVLYYDGTQLVKKFKFFYGDFECYKFVCGHYFMFKSKKSIQIFDILTRSKIMKIHHCLPNESIQNVITLSKTHFLFQCCKIQESGQKMLSKRFYFVDVDKKTFNTLKVPSLLLTAPGIQQINDEIVKIHYFDDRYGNYCSIEKFIK